LNATAWILLSLATNKISFSSPAWESRGKDCTWHDYPYRLEERSANLFHSGISLFALNQAKWPGLKDVRSQCIDLLRTSTTDIRETNGSLLVHRLDNGGVGNSPEQAIKGRSWQLAEYVYVTNFLLGGH
jgi:hypothetical protein